MTLLFVCLQPLSPSASRRFGDRRVSLLSLTLAFVLLVPDGLAQVTFLLLPLQRLAGSWLVGWLVCAWEPTTATGFAGP